MITYEVRSRKGSREKNEDWAQVEEQDGDYCFALADGLGGHGRGEVASRLAVEAALREFRQGKGREEDGIEQMMEKAQEAVLQEQVRQNACSQMKTTFAVLQTVKGQLRWGHVGDSRIYYFSRGRLAARTLDHSVPQMLVAAGQLKEKEIRCHEDRNRLLRVMGMPWDRPLYDTGGPVKQGGRQAFLLCSDGWWEWIEEKQMARCLRKSRTAGQWMDQMEEIINQQGQGKEMDNYSAVGVFLS